MYSQFMMHGQKNIKIYRVIYEKESIFCLWIVSVIVSSFAVHRKMYPILNGYGERTV